MNMTALRCLLSTTCFALVLPAAALASEFGTPDEARAMLERAVAALRTDKAAALDAFNRKDGGYRDRDLYIFCAGPDGVFTAHPRAVGRFNLKSFVDFPGDAIGEEMFNAATEGVFSTVSYVLRRGEEPTARRKTSLITKVDDQVCGVGYFDPGAIAHDNKLAVNNFEGVFIFGYDPVAYFTMGKPVRGSQEFAYEYLGAKWYFANAEHRQMFSAEPIKYIPQHGGYCSAAAASGTISAANPRAWRIIDGRLYLFAGQRVVKPFDASHPNAAAADADWQQKLMELVSQ